MLGPNPTVTRGGDTVKKTAPEMKRDIDKTKKDQNAALDYVL